MDESKIVVHEFKAALFGTFAVRTTHYSFGKEEIESVTIYADGSSITLLKNGGSLFTTGSIDIFSRV